MAINMKAKKQKILAVILVLIVVALAGVSFYVSSLLNTTKPVAPTAPRSKPKAAEWFSGANCNVAFAIAGPGLSCVKTSHDTNTSQSPIGTVGPNKEMIYKVKVTNTGNGDLTNVKVDDVLNGENQSGMTYVSSSTNCTNDSATRKVSCTIASLLKNETKEIAFKVRVQANAANGQVIKNLAVATSGEVSAECRSDITVNGIVSCNDTCTSDNQCSGSLKCRSGKCRNDSCAGESDCSCITTTVTTTVTTTGTPTATTTRRVTTTPTRSASASATPITLPDSGVFNLPGAAAFGTGLLLTVLGILFAL